MISTILLGLIAGLIFHSWLVGLIAAAAYVVVRLTVGALRFRALKRAIRRARK